MTGVQTCALPICFKKIIDKRIKFVNEPVIDGMQGFIFLSKNAIPLDASRWIRYFYNIHKNYNKTHEEQLPVITPHVCRHTFCSRMAKKGMNPKTLQYIMGHSDISITLNVYTHVRYDDAKDEMLAIYNGD